MTYPVPLTAPYPPPSIEMLNLEVMTEAEAEYQKKLIVLRDYYEGEQGTKVTARLKEFMPSISDGFEFTLNICSVIIQAVTEHLNLKSWDSTDITYSEWVTSIWTANEMESKQDDVHEQTLVDGEHFVIVGWNNEKGRPEWIPTRAYTDPSAGGDGFGCRMVYPQNDSNLDPLYAIKRWSEADEYGKVIEFKTLYYPDRIEKYYRKDTVNWLPRREPDEEWPIPWVDSTGKPLGIPVIHFVNKRGDSELADILAIQDAVNKSGLDTLISSDLTAFRIYIALGWIPTTDGKPPADDQSNWAEIQPGALYGTTNADAKFQAIEPPKETIEGLSDLTQQFVIWSALMSGTPVTRVITTKLVASDETLKQQEKPLENRVALRRSLFGSRWTRCVEMSRALQNMYGDVQVSETSMVTPIWGSRLHTDKADLEALEIKSRLGVPQEQIWREMGYSEAKIAAMKKMKEEAIKAAQALIEPQQETQENERQPTE